MNFRSLLPWLSLAVVVVAVSLIAPRAVNAWSEKEWADVQAEAEKSGVPLTLDAALKGYAPGPDSQNAAEGAKAVLRKVLMPPRVGAYSEFLGGMRDPYKKALATIDAETRNGKRPDPAQISSAVETFEPVLSEFQAALRKPDWNFRRPWHQGFAMLLPDLAQFKSLSKVLRAKAYVQWDKDPTVSLDALRSIIRLSDHIQSEPQMIGVLVAASCRRMAYDAALKLATEPSASPQDRATLLATIKSPIPAINWLRLWRVDNASMLMSLQLVTTQKGFSDLGLKPEHGPIRSRRALLSAQCQMARIMIAAERDMKKGSDDLETFRRVSQQYYPKIEEILFNFHDVFSKLSPGNAVYAGPSDTLEGLEALRRLTCLSIMMLDQPRSSSGLPSVALRPEWSDPFTKMPMVYKPVGKGFTLYSLGVNRADDGGTDDKSPDDQPLDIIVNVPIR